MVCKVCTLLLCSPSPLFLCSSLLKCLFSSFSLYPQLIHNLKACYPTQGSLYVRMFMYSFLSLPYLQLHLTIYSCVYKLTVISSPLIRSNRTAATVSYHICCISSSSSSLIDKSSSSPRHWPHYLRWSVLGRQETVEYPYHSITCKGEEKEKKGGEKKRRRGGKEVEQKGGRIEECDL